MCEHHGDGPYLIQWGSGAPCAGCHHDSCKDKWGWRELRAKFEGASDFGASSAESPDVNLLDDLMPVSQFVRQTHFVDYLIPFVAVKGQPGVISARSKSLKTTVALDALLSMATARPFLGHWEVSSAVRCAMLTAESGAPTIDETLCRIADAKGIDPEEIHNAMISCRCPRLQSRAWLDTIRRTIEERELACLVIDPTYLAAAGVKQNDLSAVAAMLEPVSRIIQDTGCTIWFVHHNRKVTESRYGCPTLEEITGSGWGEWARFWLLLNRRREWDDETGRHWLWLVTGGSAGFGARKWLDVHEGKPTDSGGRVWEVDVEAAIEGEEKEKARKEAAKEQGTKDRFAADRQAACESLAELPDCTGTKTDIRDGASTANGSRLSSPHSSAIGLSSVPR
jgi:hypothetical protein